MMKKWWMGILIIILVGIGVYLLRQRTTIKVARTTISENVGVGFIPTHQISKIAIMADIHNDVESLHKAYEQAVIDGVELIILAGDLTIDGTTNEQKKIKSEIDSWTIQTFAVPGNHDIYKQVWIFGDKYQTVKLGNWKLMLIDNSDWRGLGETQKAWLGSEVRECHINFCLAVMHMPLANTFSKHVMGEYSQQTMEEAEWLKKVLRDNKVQAGYSGHLHYSSDYEIDGWETVLVGAISLTRNVEVPKYTQVKLYSDGTRDKVVKIVP